MAKKPRRPRWPADHLAHIKTVSKVEPFSPTEMSQLIDPLRESFAAIKSGNCVELDFHNLCAALNTTLIRSKQDKLQTCVDEASAALDAMRRVWARYQESGRWGFDGPGMVDVEFALHLHEEFCRESTPLQMIKALKEVARIGAEA